jgi:hypothetical protein
MRTVDEQNQILASQQRRLEETNFAENKAFAMLIMQARSLEALLQGQVNSK